MPPVPTVQKRADGGVMHPKISSKLRLHPSLRPSRGESIKNLAHLLLAKFCGPSFLAKRGLPPALGIHVGHVGRLSARKQVVRIRACAAVAPMQNTNAFLKRSFMEEPREAMRSNIPSAEAEMPIAVRSKCASPSPAVRTNNHPVEKSFFVVISDFHLFYCKGFISKWLVVFACSFLTACVSATRIPSTTPSPLVVASCPARSPLLDDSFGSWVLKAQEVGAQYDKCRAAALADAP